MKWWSFYLIYPDGSTSVVDGEFSDLLKPYVNDSPTDHSGLVPNPNGAVAYARDKGWNLDELAHEAMIGRWELESKNSTDKYDY
jgi:hypothetical protein